jgi:hypothetical protein
MTLPEGARARNATNDSLSRKLDLVLTRLRESANRELQIIDMLIQSAGDPALVKKLKRLAKRIDTTTAKVKAAIDENDAS